MLSSMYGLILIQRLSILLEHSKHLIQDPSFTHLLQHFFLLCLSSFVSNGISILPEDILLQTGAARNPTTTLPISRWPPLPPEQQPPSCIYVTLVIVSFIEHGADKDIWGNLQMVSSHSLLSRVTSSQHCLQHM